MSSPTPQDATEHKENSNNSQYIYDIHCHVMNLSHANLLAFLWRVWDSLFAQHRKKFWQRIWFFIKLIWLALKNFCYIVLALLALLLFICCLLLSLIPFIGNTFRSIAKKILNTLGSLPISKRIINLLSFMSNDIGNMLLLMEKDVLKLQDEDKLKGTSDGNNNGFVKINDRDYKVILTPLMMDFGYKGFEKSIDIYYGMPRKTIGEQVSDLFIGIKTYEEQSTSGFFEIYPFLGINTQNYPYYNENAQRLKQEQPKLENLPDILKDQASYDKKNKKIIFVGNMENDQYKELVKMVKGQKDKKAIEVLCEDAQNVEKQNNLRKMLFKYFGKFNTVPLEERREKLFEKMGSFDGDVDNMRSFFFSGIKVYPPLGFDPWPHEDELELEKVKYLYSFCTEKNIPIITHCSMGGFHTVKQKRQEIIAAPSRWIDVIKEYPSLKLNLAHFGGNVEDGVKDEWAKKIVDIITDDNHNNVYTDFSCQCFNEKHYKALVDIISYAGTSEKIEKLKKRILFGSDFMINLLNTSSYHEYLHVFHNLGDNVIPPEEKMAFCSENAQRFLFGKVEEIQQDAA